MARWGRWAALAVAAAIGASSPAAAQEGARFCHAFDPASNAIFTSQALSGDDRRSAGEFAAFLKARGSVGGEVSAACQGAAGAPQVERAKETLARTCPNCNAGTRMVSVNWPMALRPEGSIVDGRAAETTAERASVFAPSGAAGSAAVARGGGIVAQPAGGSAGTIPSPAPIVNVAPRPVTPTPMTREPLLVVLGNERDGRMLVFHDIPGIVATATREARRYRPDGWKVLVSSTDTGNGAAMCVSETDRATGEKRVHFFAAFPHASPREAIKAAQEKVRPVAAQLRETSYICGAPWWVHGPVPEREVTLADSVIGAVKGFIYRQVTCELPPPAPASKIVPIYGPDGPIRAQSQSPMQSGPASCPKPEKFFRTKYTCMCVRG